MIPYFSYTTIPIGPLTLQVWGLFVAIGMLLGTSAAVWLARRRSLKEGVLWDMSVWCFLGAFVGARLVHVLFYDLATYVADPMEILRVWHGGYSSVGGMMGGALVGIWFLRRAKVDVYAYADTAIFGLPVGLALGRLGCFLIHDHPGTASDFLLSIRYPDGVSRHDLGLYLSINAAFLFALFCVLAKRGAKQGTYIVVFLLWYGISRFLLDFLRATEGGIVDARYAGLTPAQYISLGMILVGGLLVVRKIKKLPAKN